MAKAKRTLQTEGISHSFSQRLKKLMKEKKLATSDIANLLGITRQSVGLYIAGKGFPEIPSIIKLSDFLGVTVDELLTGKKPENKTFRELTGLSEQAIENIKEIKTMLVHGDNDEKFSVLHLLNEILEDSGFKMLLVELDVWQKGLKKNPSAFHDFLHSKTGSMGDYYRWRLLDILSKFFEHNVQKNLDNSKAMAIVEASNSNDN